MVSFLLKEMEVILYERITESYFTFTLYDPDVLFFITGFQRVGNRRGHGDFRRTYLSAF